MGNFELDQTNLFYKFITVVSSILLYHMYGGQFILFPPPPALISGAVQIQNINIYLICYCSVMDGSKTITRRYPGRGSVYYSVWWISILLGVAFKLEKTRRKEEKRNEKSRGGGGGRGSKGFRSHTSKYNIKIPSRYEIKDLVDTDLRNIV